MNAAIYARKSTEQTDVPDEAKSVTRQIEHSREYAAKRGWTVADDCIFSDDGISGAEFANRPGLMRLMNALTPKPAFQALIMSDLDRLGREGIETPYTVKRLNLAGVSVFTYLDDREIRLDSPITALMTQVQAFGAAIEREKARQRTHEAMSRKARAGHVTGGRVFGYENRPCVVPGLDGQNKRLHVERVIVEMESAVVRRIFELCAKGHGLTSIAKTLNEEGAPSPRAQQGRPKGWAPSSVREVLHRRLYRGEIVWNQTQKRDRWGKKHQQPRPESEWVSVPAPDLRIISDESWEAAHAQIAANRARYGMTALRTHPGRPPGSGGKYLFSGLLRCGLCGGSLEARSRSHGRERVLFYGCSSYQRRGCAVCRNRLTVPMIDTDHAILDVLEDRLIHPGVIEAALQRTVDRITGEAGVEVRERITAKLTKVQSQLANLAQAVADGGDSRTLTAAIHEHETLQASLERELKSVGARTASFDISTVRKALRSRLQDWRERLREHPEQARVMVRRLIVGRLDFRPNLDGRYYEFRGVGTLQPIIAGVVPHNLASPTGFEPVFRP